MRSHSKASVSGITTTHVIKIAAKFMARTKQTELRVHTWGPECAQTFTPQKDVKRVISNCEETEDGSGSDGTVPIRV